jgi:TatD DNase family protein
MLFDTHVHLNDPTYLDYKKIIQNALEHHVTKMVVVGYDLESSKRAVKIANEYSFIYACIGIHPSEEKTNYKEDLIELEKLISDKVVAIGEIGLDYHYENIDKERQKELFVLQLKLAYKYHLPIAIHSRDACNDTYKILQENKDCYSRGIMHCYSYSLQMSKEFIKLGFLLGIGGVLTYKNAKEIKEVVKDTSLDNLVLETDAPYLPPTPYRGQINEPQYLELVAKEMANLKEIEIKDVEEITYNNACDFFGVSHEN